LYKNEDNTFSTYCFGCEVAKQNVDETGRKLIKNEKKDTNKENTKPNTFLSVVDISEYPSLGLRDRGIVKNLAEFYGLRVAKKSREDKITHHYYPYHKGDRLVGYQERVVSSKRFLGVGYAKNDIQLQGQHLWPNGGGKSLAITEGFLDALSLSQVVCGKGNDRRYPIVSLPNGANMKCIANNLEWINSFSKVILMLDQDAPGQKASREIANMIRPGLAYISKFSEKDASDMLMNGKQDELRNAYWSSQKYSPSDIVTASSAREILSKDNEVPSMPFPDFASELNIMEYGKRKGEITIFTSGTGMGKSQFVKEDIFATMNDTEDKVGVVSLEESTRETLIGLQSLYLNKRIHLPDVDVSKEDLEKSFKWLEDTCGDRLVMLDHQGSSVNDDLLDKIRYLIAIGCKYLYIDHITIAVSGQSDQNRAIDDFMESLLKLCKRNQVWFGVVSHLRKTGGDKKSFESGAIPTDDDLKGSGSIKQIAFTIIAFVRNKMAKVEKTRNTTKVYILKSRYTGRTGYAGSFRFESSTGRLLEAEKNEHEDEEMSGDEFELAG
jgi:twinkle protein